MRYILLNKAWAATNWIEIKAIAEDNGVGEAWLQPTADPDLVGCKGFNPEQMITIPDTVYQEPHLPNEVDYGLENAASHANKVILVKQATPVKAVQFDTVKDYFVVARQHGGLVP